MNIINTQAYLVKRIPPHPQHRTHAKIVMKRARLFCGYSQLDSAEKAVAAMDQCV